MTINVNNTVVNFKKCFRDISSKEEAEIWKAFVKIRNIEVEFEVYNECYLCGTKIDEKVNWKGISEFLEMLDEELNNLKQQAQTSLLYLAKQMKFWKNEYETRTFFHLDGVDYLSLIHI